MDGIIPPDLYSKIWSFYPEPYSCASFDLGNKAFGVAHIVFDPYQLVGLPRIDLIHECAGLEAKLEMAERLAKLYAQAIEKMLTIWVDVWDLMPGVEWKDVDMDLTARNLKKNLVGFDKQAEPFTEILYEFQMNVNDKSRTVSQFIRYHYAGVYPVAKIGGSLKNTITLTPDLDHRKYLERYQDPYKANKHHAADSLRYLAKTWKFRIDHIPANKIKDAGDALMQMWAHIFGKPVAKRPKKPAKRTKKVHKINIIET